MAPRRGAVSRGWGASPATMITTTLIAVLIAVIGGSNLLLTASGDVTPDWASPVNTFLLIVLAVVAQRNGSKSDRNHEVQGQIAARIEQVADKVDSASTAAASAADAAASAAEAASTASRIAKDVGRDVREKRRRRWYDRD